MYILYDQNRYAWAENLEANSNSVSKPITPSHFFTCDRDAMCIAGEVCGSHGEKSLQLLHLATRLSRSSPSEPIPPPNMAEDPLRHTSRDGLSHNNYDGAGISNFFAPLTQANDARFFSRLRCPVLGSQAGCYHFCGVTSEAGF
jgi:hypothetical protein